MYTLLYPSGRHVHPVIPLREAIYHHGYTLGRLYHHGYTLGRLIHLLYTPGRLIHPVIYPREAIYHPGYTSGRLYTTRVIPLGERHTVAQSPLYSLGERHTVAQRASSSSCPVSLLDSNSSPHSRFTVGT